MTEYKYEKIGNRKLNDSELEFVQMYKATIEKNNAKISIPIIILNTDIYSGGNIYTVVILLKDTYFKENFKQEYKVIYDRVKNIDYAKRNGCLYEWLDEFVNDCLYENEEINAPIEGIVCWKKLLKRDITMEEKCKNNANITLEEISDYRISSILQKKQ